MRYTVASKDLKCLEYCKSTRHLRNVLKTLNYNGPLEIKGFKKVNGSWLCVVHTLLNERLSSTAL